MAIAVIRRSIYLLIAGAALMSACSDSGVDAPAGEEVLAGGATTVYDLTSNAFSTPAPNLSGAALERHMDGDAAFEATFVTAPATVNTGLGPVYNNNSCISCHARDGRGRPPGPGENIASMLFRVSIPGQADDGGPLAAPGFGTQLQERSVFGIQAEGAVAIDYTDSIGYFADGQQFHLRVPRYSLRWTYSPADGSMMLSPRVAPPVFGLGLLEAVNESTVLGFADESDRDGDGISGRPNRVRDIRSGMTVLGRFGWKAGAPSLLQQAAGAYHDDMGITTSVFPVEACHGQPQSDNRGDDPELSDEALAATVFYTQTLGVPARRNVRNENVRRGEVVFREAGCTGCHRPSMTTGMLQGVPEVSGQRIAPFTDLLLHDMGNGLADGRPDYVADGREWRTAALWGVGLTQIVNGHTYLLHDGRARNLMEAIMWHGGEAERTREYVRKLPAPDRSALIAFLESL